MHRAVPPDAGEGSREHHSRRARVPRAERRARRKAKRQEGRLVPQDRRRNRERGGLMVNWLTSGSLVVTEPVSGSGYMVNLLSVGNRNRPRYVQTASRALRWISARNRSPLTLASRPERQTFGY